MYITIRLYVYQFHKKLEKTPENFKNAAENLQFGNRQKVKNNFLKSGVDFVLLLLKRSKFFLKLNLINMLGHPKKLDQHSKSFIVTTTSNMNWSGKYVRACY